VNLFAITTSFMWKLDDITHMSSVTDLDDSIISDRVSTSVEKTFMI